MNKYNGEDILEVMKLAKNYNNYLLNLIYCNIYKHKSSVICDFGSGTGYLSNELSKLIKKDIICVENAYNLQKYYKLDNLILKHDLIELEDNFLDFIYSLNVLEHIEDDIEIIDLFYKKIREKNKRERNCEKNSKGKIYTIYTKEKNMKSLTQFTLSNLVYHVYITP